MQNELNQIPTTVESLIDFSNKNHMTVNEVIERLYELKREQQKLIVLPSVGVKPTYSSSFDSKQTMEYAKKLEQWEIQSRERKLAEMKRKTVGHIDGLLEQFIKHEADLDSVPEQYRAKLYSYAWERGHSSGYSEVYGCLEDLVAIFN